MKIQRVRTYLKKRDGIFSICNVLERIPSIEDIINYLKTDCCCVEFKLEDNVVFYFRLEDGLIVNPVKERVSHKFTKKEKAEMMDFLNLTYGGFYEFYRGNEIYFKRSIK